MAHICTFVLVICRPLNVNTGANVGYGMGLSPTSKPVVSHRDVHNDKSMLMGRERGRSSSSLEDRLPNSIPFAPNAFSPKDSVGVGHQPSLQRNLSCSSTGSSAGGVADKEMLATKVCMSFVDEKVAVREWLSCVVCHVDDPQNFYCQLEGDQNVELLEALMSRIEKYVGSLPPGIGVLHTATLGQPVVAKYNADGSWYRARVTGMYEQIAA
jgi:Tudor domain